MATLAEELSRLTNTAPTWEDPEDISDGAKLLARGANGEEEEELGPSILRKRAAIDDDDEGRYHGRKISRKSLVDGEEPGGKNGSDEFDDDDDEDDEIESENEIGEEQDLSADSDDEENDENDDSDDDEDSDVDSDQQEVSYVSYANASQNESLAEIEDEDAGINRLAGNQDDKQKAQAVHHQLNFWESLLKCRIELQKVMSKANQLPQPDTCHQFSSVGGQHFTQSQQQAKLNIVKVLKELVKLQTTLLLQNSDTASIAKDGKHEVKPDNDEEIASDSEAEEETKQKPVQAELKLSAYPDFITKRHQQIAAYRDDTIQKWYDKTRISSARLSKGFNAFDQSALKQIKQILADKERLVKRTQLKRSNYRILGVKEEPTPDEEATAGSEALPSREHLKEYNPEIFDDDDFYHQLLREIIESKSRDINDPIAITRHWLEIQKLRSRVKRKVDTRASKGRKIRYDVHPKLVNFMAAVETSSWTDEAKNDLYSSLFGKQSS